MTSAANTVTGLIVREGGPVATIEIDRPDEGNTINGEMMAALPAILARLGTNEAIRAIAIRSRGPAFCRGRDGRGDSRAPMSAFEFRYKRAASILNVYEAIGAVPIPVVACVQGPANGFGAALAGGSDITLASDAARFSFDEINHGIAPTLAMSAVMRKVPPKALAYLIYSGREFDAREAMFHGLASTVFPAASFAAEADRFLAELGARPRLLLETVKRFQSKGADLSVDMAAEYAGTLMAVSRSGP
ncbi:MAG TPA: enoyl-CoA hydratase/isomerase family protein [Candidatus Sulfotelmatobacter sp.]|nr:enoyl-CoA hydratase/isomerase family protein [Candidatus Sulfotelmatobacter sp.]